MLFRSQVPSPLVGEGESSARKFAVCVSCWPGAARRPVTFLASPRKVTKRSAPDTEPRSVEREGAHKAASTDYCRCVAAAPAPALRDTVSQPPRFAGPAGCPALLGGSQGEDKPRGCTVPCETPSNANAPGGVGEDCLSPCRVATRASSAAAQRSEQRRGVRRTGELGAASFGYFSWRFKKSNQPPGCPRRT